MSASARIPDANGWYEIKANPLSRVGVYPYRGSSIKAPNPDALYQVYRPAMELSKPETLQSLKLLPWIDDHTMLGDPAINGYTPPEKKGVQGVIGEDVFFKDDTIYGNIKVWSLFLRNLIDSGKDELSCGYRCQYDWSPSSQNPRPTYNGQPYDVIQRNIRFNHLALVEDGRMGPDVSVLDAADIDGVLIATFDTKDFKPMAEKQTAPDDSMTVAEMKGHLDKIGPQIADLHQKLANSVTPSDMQNAMDAAIKPIKEAMDAMTAKIGTVKKGDPKSPIDAKDKKEGMDEDMDETGMDAKMIATMDAAIDKAVKPLVDEIASLKSAAAAAPKGFMSEIRQRDALVQKLSPFVGTFDHAEMTLAEVAKYGAEKLNLNAAGQELVAVEAYLNGRSVPRRRTEGTGMDGKDKGGSSVTSFLKSTAA